MLKIVDKIQDENIFEKVDAADKDSLLDFISEKAAEKSSVSKEIILEAVKKREEEESTGIGKGIAIPHCKVPGVGETLVFVFLLDGDVDYDALDNEFVQAVFFLLADEEDNADYMLNLSQLTFLISQNSIVDKLLEAEDKASFIEVLQSAKELEDEYKHETQIKYLIELQRADSQIYVYELEGAEQDDEEARQKDEVLIAETKKYRNHLAEKIDKKMMSMYNRISERYSGRALAKIDGYTCSACHIEIPKVTVNEVRRQQRVIHCLNCGRILFP